MLWWDRNKRAVAPSPSPSSSASSPGSGRNRSRYFHFPWRRRSDSHRQPPRFPELSHISDTDTRGLSFDSAAAAGSAPHPCASSAAGSRSPNHLDSNPGRTSSAPALLPRPLPVREFELSQTAASPHHESTSPPARGFGLSSPTSTGCPLPSPREFFSRLECDAGSHAAIGFSIVEPIHERTSLAGERGRLSQRILCRSPENPGISMNGVTSRCQKKIFQNPNSAGTANFRLNIPAKSAPTSGFASPVHSAFCSPRRLSNVDISAFATATPGPQIWSTAEIQFTDTIPAFSSQTSPEKFIGSPECSPRYSLTAKNADLRLRNISAPSSPLHTRMFSDNSGSWQENGGNLDLYPLPLPPQAVSPPHPGVSNQNGTKAEVLVMTSQWNKGELIGSGTFGKVYVATNRHTGALCAMKEVHIIPDDAKSAESIKQLEQEINFLSQFEHPNIVKYYGSETIDDQFYIYLEYVHPGSINKYIHQHRMTESVIRNFTRHILKGLAYLHSKKIMHRDIKGANLLVNAQGVVKLADFGMAKHLSGAAGALSLKGSPYWMAPEMMQATMNSDIGCDLAVDIWSVGCTIIEMFTGKQPWSGLEVAAVMFKVLHKDPPIPESLSDDGKDFLRRCFRRNPADRPTANQLLDHPFIRHSCHYNVHDSSQAFEGIKSSDTTIIPRGKGTSRSDLFAKVKHSCDGEGGGRSYPKISDTTASRTSPFLEFSPCLSPRQTKHEASSSIDYSGNFQNGVQLSRGNFDLYASPKAQNKVATKPF